MHHVVKSISYWKHIYHNFYSGCKHETTIHRNERTPRTYWCYLCKPSRTNDISHYITKVNALSAVSKLNIYDISRQEPVIGSAEYCNEPKLWSSAMWCQEVQQMGTKTCVNPAGYFLFSTITIGEASFFDAMIPTYQTIKHQTADVCNPDTPVGNSNLVG